MAEHASENISKDSNSVSECDDVYENITLLRATKYNDTADPRYPHDKSITNENKQATNKDHQHSKFPEMLLKVSAIESNLSAKIKEGIEDDDLIIYFQSQWRRSIHDMPMTQRSDCSLCREAVSKLQRSDPQGYHVTAPNSVYSMPHQKLTSDILMSPAPVINTLNGNVMCTGVKRQKQRVAGYNMSFPDLAEHAVYPINTGYGHVRNIDNDEERQQLAQYKMSLPDEAEHTVYPIYTGYGHVRNIDNDEQGQELAQYNMSLADEAEQYIHPMNKGYGLTDHPTYYENRISQHKEAQGIWQLHDRATNNPRHEAFDKAVMEQTQVMSSMTIKEVKMEKDMNRNKE